MLFYLHDLKALSGAFNLFFYITFRAGGAALTSLVISLLAGPSVIGALRRKKIGQVIRTEGPQSHSGKSGTPTMGGLLIFLAIVLSALLWMRLDDRYTWVMLFVTVVLAAVGAYDDWSKLSQKSSKGLSS